MGHGVGFAGSRSQIPFVCRDALGSHGTGRIYIHDRYGVQYTDAGARLAERRRKSLKREISFVRSWTMEVFPTLLDRTFCSVVGPCIQPLPLDALG